LLGTSRYYFRKLYWEFELLSDNGNTENFIMINLFNLYCLHKKVVTLSWLQPFKFLLLSF
jgi:hypothetical protein